MSEFFLELFSEEIPPNLQISARENLISNFTSFFEQKKINYHKNYSALSTPNRLIIYFESIQNEVIENSKEIKGPNINVSDEALKSYLSSNKITKDKIFKKKIDKGEFYFYRVPKKKFKTKSLLEENIPDLLTKIRWKKSMKWGTYDLYWGRPLKSIMAIFDRSTLKFNYHHLISSNKTFIDKNFEEKTKVFRDFKSYKKFFYNQKIIINHNDRKKYIENKLVKITKLRKCKIFIKDKLLNDVTNILDRPNIITCSFDKRFLNMPKELVISTVEFHQKFFLVYDRNSQLINTFYVVSDCPDTNGLIKKGNENVVDARLTDAEYFWKKNKSKNMIKQVSLLDNINYFNGLGSYLDKVQRLKKIGGLLSDEFLISKEKVELACTLSKVDLLSELVNEFPELQGILGGYFAEAQGFDKEISESIKDQYLPSGPGSVIPRNNYSIALSISDKIDTLVGFFGLNIIPTSSKDPYGLRRLAIGLIKIIIHNKKNIKLKDLINFSCQVYSTQSINFNNKIVIDKITSFILERFKYFMKEKEIRQDIIETSLIDFKLDNLLIIYIKAQKLNKIINKEIGIDLIKNYKRSFNILNTEMNKIDNENFSNVDPALFKSNYEKDLYKKLHDIRKDFNNIKIENDYDTQLSLLSTAKKEITNFFDNVIVNDGDEDIKKNRLLLLKLVCKTFDNYLSFAKLETTK